MSVQFCGKRSTRDFAKADAYNIRGLVKRSNLPTNPAPVNSHMITLPKKKSNLAKSIANTRPSLLSAQDVPMLSSDEKENLIRDSSMEFEESPRIKRDHSQFKITTKISPLKSSNELNVGKATSHSNTASALTKNKSGFIPPRSTNNNCPNLR